MSRFRRLLQVSHRWVALLAGAYLLLVSLTGAALLFRIDLQRALDPSLFRPVASGPLAEPALVFSRLAEAYPGSEITGMDTPTNRRPTTLAYVLRENRFLTVLIDPASGQILGELRQRPLIRWLNRLHFDLTLGRTGRTINGIGALVLTGLGLTGLILWWRGRRLWKQGLIVRRSQSRATFHRDLHSAAGIWTSLALLVWGVTGAAFIFPTPFMNAISRFSPVEAAEPPEVAPPPTGTPRAPLADQIAAATRARPGDPIARIVLPGHPRVALQVLFTAHSPTRIGEPLTPVYVDPWRATVIGQGAPRSAGEALWNSFTTLHTAGFGGYGVRFLWLLFALAPALLLCTGLITWWLRIFRR
jgi:uncharacterized iron-regulated membrane protein